MARWDRRPKPDYSHLYGRPLDVILDGAIANRSYGRDRRTFPAEVNLDLIDLFEGRDRLAVGELMDAHAALVVRTGRGADWSEVFRADVVGNLIGWGVHLGILKETPDANGERGWRLVERELRYDVCAGRAQQIRGLPGDEQAAMNRRRLAAERRAATLDRRSAETLTPLIATALSHILAATPDATVPVGWSRFVGEDLPARWPLLREAFGLLVEAHRESPRRRRQDWLYLLGREGLAARHLAQRRAEEAKAAELAEDAAAFEDL